MYIKKYLLLILGFFPIYSYSITAKDIVQKSDNILRGKTSVMNLKMTIITPNWKRSIKLKLWENSKQKKSFIRINYPSKEKGTGFLKINYNLWMYIPNLEKIIKIPPSMMMQSWMGSDFTNDDLVKESSIVKDYNHKIISENKKEYKIALIPKENAAVTWGKIIVWIRKKDYIPIKEEFYDEKAKLIRVWELSNIKKMGGRKIPTLWEMKNLTKKGNKTKIEITRAKFNIKIKDKIFTLRNLKHTR